MKVVKSKYRERKISSTLNIFKFYTFIVTVHNKMLLNNPYKYDKNMEACDVGHCKIEFTIITQNAW